MNYYMVKNIQLVRKIKKMIKSLEDKLKEVKEIRKKLKEEGYHQPLSWKQVKKAITYNWKEQDKNE